MFSGVSVKAGGTGDTRGARGNGDQIPNWIKGTPTTVLPSGKHKTPAFIEMNSPSVLPPAFTDARFLVVYREELYHPKYSVVLFWANSFLNIHND